MKVLLDIKDDKAPHLMEVLRSLPYVKARQLSLKPRLFSSSCGGAAEAKPKKNENQNSFNPRELSFEI